MHKCVMQIWTPFTPSATTPTMNTHLPGHAPSPLTTASPTPRAARRGRALAARAPAARRAARRRAGCQTWRGRAGSRRSGTAGSGCRRAPSRAAWCRGRRRAKKRRRHTGRGRAPLRCSGGRAARSGSPCATCSRP
eukprot:877641-Prymnesium_polylepis.1